MKKIKKGDDVIVLSGRDRGRRGTVLDITSDGKRVRVNDINLVHRHTRPNPQANQTGGIVQKEAPIHISNLAVYNPLTSKGDRVGFRFLQDGKKVRYFKSNGEVINESI